MKSDTRGYSLLELLCVLSISTIVVSSLILSLNCVQVLTHDLSSLSDRNRSHWIVPILLVQWIAGAGNNRWNHQWEGVSVSVDSAAFKADIDGNTGFPDDVLLSSYEDIAIRHREETLSLRSGSGSYQPVLRRIRSFETERPEERLILVEWSAVTALPLRTRGERVVDSAEMKIHLWNYRSNLFLERVP